jgi:mannonate dehydratase
MIEVTPNSASRQPVSLVRHSHLANTCHTARKVLMKLSFQLSEDFTDDDLAFVHQLGVEHVSVNLITKPLGSIAAASERITAAGLSIANIQYQRLRNIPEITLNLPGRDEKIAEFIEGMRESAAVGVDYSTYAHMADGIWMSPPVPARGGALSRHYDPADAEGFWLDQRYTGNLAHGRAYTTQEIWDNFAYFMEKVLPVAENLGVRLGVHPDDPPVPVLGGVPRSIFSSMPGYLHALDAFPSPSLGVCLCLGTWLEGGTGMGVDAVGAIEEFAARGKLFKVHLRNVSSALPVFTETFIDEGYGDMPSLARALRDNNFDGILIADHVPAMIGGRYASWAYPMGYIKGLFDAVYSEPVAARAVV